MAKRAERETKEGRVSVKTDGKNYAMIYLGCETDFVAKTDAFIQLADDLAQYVLEHPGADYMNDEHIKAVITEQAPKFGENTTLKGAYNWTPAEGGVMAYYVHSDNKKPPCWSWPYPAPAKTPRKWPISPAAWRCTP